MKPELEISVADLGNRKSVIHNFEVSVVMPFFQKMEEFYQILPLNAPYFQRNGIEVIISMDDDSEQDALIDFIKQYPFINWKVIANHNKHGWRNPTKAINVGIKHATKKYVLVCSPESEFYTDAIYLMRKALEYYDQCFAIGTVAFAIEEDIRSDNLDFCMPYGSIMAKRSDLEAISGYDESLSAWGGDDNNIRARLELYGVRKLLLPEVQLIHCEPNGESKRRRFHKRALLPFECEYPNIARANNKEWGADFDHIVYDWRNNQYAEELVKIYLANFKDYTLIDPSVFTKKYKRIVLAQSYNEIEGIHSFLEHMALYFDGIVLLDDESTDGTYELANHPKLLLKVQKQRIGFIDIENRNMLMDIASFFSSEWFCFMDIDERFDARFADFDKATANKEIDTLLFRFVHLWDNEKLYNAEYPYMDYGVGMRYRMFRNIGHAQMYSSKKLHFLSVPHLKQQMNSEILFLHYGNISKERRIKKYQFYQREDTEQDQQGYDHLIAENSKLLNVCDIQLLNGDFANPNN